MLLYEVVSLSTAEVQTVYMDATFGVGDMVVLNFGDGNCVWKVTAKYYKSKSNKRKEACAAMK